MHHASVLYDGRAAATPSQLTASIARDARIGRLKALAQPDRPIACLSASERAAIIVEMPKKQIIPDVLPIYQAYVLFPDAMLWCYDLVKSAFTDGPAKLVRPQHPRIEDIQRACARHWRVSVLDLKSSRRTANIVRPRQVAMYLARILTLRSLPEIGNVFGHRDHTTVLHAFRKIEALIVTDLALADDVETVKLHLGA